MLLKDTQILDGGLLVEVEGQLVEGQMIYSKKMLKQLQLATQLEMDLQKMQAQLVL